jgi:hypothetical protein
MSPDDKDFSNDDFLKHSKKLLDDSVDSLDAATLSGLNQARQKALGSRRSNVFSGNRAGLAFASLAVAVLAILLWTATPDQPSAELAQQYEDIDILTADADLELLEDLEFVSWLLEENQASPVELNDAG